MAQAILAESKLRLVFEAGMDENGKALFRAKTFNNVKKEATTDQLFQVAQAVAVLCNDPLTSVERDDRLDVIA